MYNYIIIGGGFGGLSSAALLSRKGKKVLLVEKASVLGGRAHYFEKDGYVWQYGQHSHRLGPDGHANMVMRRLGDPLDFYTINQNKAKLFYKGKLFNRPSGPMGFLTTKALSFKARLKFLYFYTKLLKLDSSLWYDRTLIDLYRSFLKSDPELERFLNFLGFTIMLPDAAIVSAGEVIDFIQRVAKVPVPVADIPGGSKTIIEKLRSHILENNGEILLSEKVKEITITEKKASGIITDKGSYTSRNVVFAAPVKGITNLLDESLFDDSFLDYIKNLKNSGGVVIDLVSNEPLSDLEGGILGVDEPLWVKFQTLFDNTVAPEGHHVCTWGLLSEWGKANDPSAILKTEKRLREIMAICMPGYKNKVLKERKISIPVVNANMLIPMQSRPYRPNIQCQRINNLYFVGDTVCGEGCSGDIAFSSALMLDDIVN